MRMNWARPGWTALLLLVMGGALASAQDGNFVPVTDAMLQAPSADDWPMWRRTLDGWGYSPLDQIDRRNVGDLRLVWSRALTAGGRQQGTPLGYDGVIYMPNPSDVECSICRRDTNSDLSMTFSFKTESGSSYCT